MPQIKESLRPSLSLVSFILGKVSEQVLMKFGVVHKSIIQYTGVQYSISNNLSENAIRPFVAWTGKLAFPRYAKRSGVQRYRLHRSGDGKANGFWTFFLNEIRYLGKIPPKYPLGKHPALVCANPENCEAS